MKFTDKINQILNEEAGGIASQMETDTTPDVAEIALRVYKLLFEGGYSIHKGITADMVDQRELEIGLQIEKEHILTGVDPILEYKIVEKIALDHLAEIPDYYTRLVEMEQEAKGE